MRKHYLLFSALAMAFLFSPAQAQVGRIAGVVKDADGKPLKDVKITIEGLEVKRNYQTKTNKEGKYVHAGVSSQGTYRVVAKKDGYQSDYVQGVKPTYDTTGGNIDFTLKPGPDRPLAYELSEEEKAAIIKQNEEAKKKKAMMAAVQAAFNTGIEAFNQAHFEEALTSFKDASEKDAAQPAVWAYLGETYERLSRGEEAIAAYQKAIALTPEDPGLYQNLGNIYAARGNTEKAKELYEKSASLSSALDPKAAATTYYNMGVTYINNGNTEEAAGALKKAVEMDPAHAEAHYQLGITLIGLNDMPGAVDHLKKYLSLAPSGPNAETAKALVQQLGQ